MMGWLAHRVRFGVSVLALALLVAGPAAAGETVMAFTARVADEVLAVLAARLPLDAKHRQLDGLLRRYADLKGMARALATEAYDRATPGQRKAYEATFGRYVYQTYIRRARHFRGEKVTLTGTEQGRDGRAVVLSQVRVTEKMVVPVRWILSRVDDRWRLFDVRIGAFGLLALKKGYFRTLLKRRANRLAGLSQELEAQAAKRQVENDRLLLSQRPAVRAEPLPEKD